MYTLFPVSLMLVTMFLDQIQFIMVKPSIDSMLCSYSIIAF